MKKVRIKILLAGGQEIAEESTEGTTIFEILKNHGVEFNTPCGGQGICGKCLVQCFPESSFSEPRQDEVKLLGEEKLSSGFRLACLVRVLSDCVVSLSEANEYLEIEGLKEKRNALVEPLTKRKVVKIDKNESGDILTEIMKKLDERVEIAEIDFPVDVKNPLGEVQVIIGNRKILKIRENDGVGGIGLAIDIGTTTVVAALVDLETGDVLDSAAFMNPQRRFGYDVISRINHTFRKKEGLAELQEVIVNKINTALNKMLSRRNYSLEQLDQIVITGNTTMSHIIAGLPVGMIGIAPYRSFSNLPVLTNAKSLGFLASEHTGLYIFPSLAAYIGGDIVAGIIATRLLENRDELFVDLGTNGELVLSMKGELLCCSTAAGPAFEGANIECGLGNVIGAIEKIEFDAGQIETRTIGKGKARGICGSGIIAVIARLLENKIISPSGRFYSPDEMPPEYRANYEEKTKRFWLTDSVYISQKDIRNFQLAKGALRTGVDVLIRNSGLSKPKAIRIAGGFGAHLSVSDLFRTGILPSELDCPVIFEGNTAINGSVGLLLNREYLKDIEKIRDSSRYIELSSLKDFQEMFVENLSFQSVTDG